MKLYRFLAIASLETRTLFGRPLMWTLVAFVLLTTAILNVTAPISPGDAAGGLKPHVNSQHAMAWLFAMTSFLIYGFFASIMAGLSVIRDDEHQVSDLLHGTPLTIAEYIGGKLAGVLAALGVVLSLHVLWAILLYQVLPAEGPSVAHGPFRLASFVVPALLLAVPLIWFFAVLAFAVGEWTRQPIVVFVVPIISFFVIFFCMNWTPPGLAPSTDRLVMILDPSGLRWLMQTVFRTDQGVEYYNTNPVAFDRTFLLNRLFVLILPLLAALATIRHCRTRVAGGGFPIWRSLARFFSRARPAEVKEEAAETAERLIDLEMTRSTPSFLSSTIQIARSEFRELRSQPAIYLLIPLFLSMIWENATSAFGPFNAPSILTSGVLATSSVGVITIFMCLVLLFFTVESIQREKTTRIDAILFAAPFRTGALLLAKSLASAAIAAAMLLVTTATSLAILSSQEIGRVEIWPLLLVWGLVLPPTFLLWNTFVIAVLAIVRERYTTYAIGLAALLLSFYHLRQESMTWTYNWTLLGTLRWSDMGTFDLNGEALLLNRVTVVALAIFLIAVAVRNFARVEPDAAGAVSRRSPRRLLISSLQLAPFALLPLATGSLLAYQVHVGFQGDPARQQEKEYWRRNFATWKDFETANITHVDLAVDLEPSQRSLTVQGTYSLINEADEAMDRLPFTVDPAFGEVIWSLDGESLQSDNRAGLHVLGLQNPLEPGASTRVGFAYQATYPKGFTKNGGGLGQFILPSGVALHTLRNSFLPVPGFVHGLGVDAENAFDPAEVAEDFWRSDKGANAKPPEVFTTRVSVSAPSDYTANSVGVKTAESTRDGRTTVVWESDHPVGAINIVAGRWDVRRHGDTAVFHHPKHDYNVDEILNALVAARERYSEWFYPYPWKELRLNEFPNQVTNAMGFPTNIPFSESIGFLTQSDFRTRPAFLVTAHEAAHQWWGNVLMAGEGPGTAHLVEGMAHYSALLLYESEFGLQGRIEFTKHMENNYIRARRVDSELPVAKMTKDNDPADWTVVYEKGAWVQWMLQNHLGRDQAMAGLQAFIRHYVANPGQPTLQDMIEFLRPYAAAPEAYQAFVDQWFFDVVLPEYRITDTSVVKSGDSWDISATVENIGSGTAPAEIVVARGERFAEDAPEPALNYLEDRVSVVLAPGTPQRISWHTSFSPEHLTVDPDFLILQLNRERAAAELSRDGIR